jgi:hypothetical protein
VLKVNEHTPSHPRGMGFAEPIQGDNPPSKPLKLPFYVM